MITKEQIAQYYESRLPNQRLNWNLKNVPARCRFHEDKEASLSIHAETGKWKCHAGCGQGGIIAFEQKLFILPMEDAQKAISDLLGVKLWHIPLDVYQYTDAAGKVLYEKIRFPPKKFLIRRREEGKYVWGIGGQPPSLYLLHRVVTARFIFLCNGEKASDRLNMELEKSGRSDSIATCPYAGEGASKWRSDYNKYFAGKHVVIFADNDKVGFEHAEFVAQQLIPWAHVVKMVALPDLPEHGDVYDYLEKNSLESLMGQIKITPRLLLTPNQQRSIFVSTPEFLAHSQDRIDWLLDGAIQRGGNGLIVGLPGAAKSWLAMDLALSMSLGEPCLNMNVPRRLKVCYMAREDHAALTSWRLKHLYQGKGSTLDLSETLFMNSKKELPQFYLDNDEYLLPVIDELQKIAPDVLFLDVLNVLHAAEENDNTQMRKVMAQITRITTAINCTAVVVHHDKREQTMGSLKQRARGASAIGGWAEWMMALSIVNPQDPQREWKRRLEMETKMSAPHDPIEFFIDSAGEGQPVRLLPVGYQSKKTSAQPTQMPLQ